MTTLETYLRELNKLRHSGAGTDELSFYAPLLNLLNEVGRALRLEEAQYVTEIGRRIAAVLLLQPRLDANYQAVKANAYEWGAM